MLDQVSAHITPEVPELRAAYSQGIAECSYPWELQAEVGSEEGPRTYRYHPGLGYFVAPEPRGGGFETTLAPEWDSTPYDLNWLTIAFLAGFDVKIYAYSRTSRTSVKIYFNSAHY